MAGEISTEAQRRIALITTADEERHGLGDLREAMTSIGHTILGTYASVSELVSNCSGELSTSDVVVHYEPRPLEPLGDTAKSLEEQHVPGARVYISTCNLVPGTKQELKGFYDAVACGVDRNRKELFEEVATVTIPRAEPWISGGVGL